MEETFRALWFIVVQRRNALKVQSRSARLRTTSSLKPLPDRLFVAKCDVADGLAAPVRIDGNDDRLTGLADRSIVVVAQRSLKIPLHFHRVAEIVQRKRIFRVQLESLAQYVFRLLASPLLQQHHCLDVSAIDLKVEIGVRT